MELNVKERVIIPKILPPMGDLEQQKTVKSIIEKVHLKEPEIKNIGFKVLKDGSSEWQKDFNKDIELNDNEVDLIRLSCQKLIESKRVMQDTIDLVERFVPE